MEKRSRQSQPHPPGSRLTLLWLESPLSVGSTRISSITSQAPSLELSAGFCPFPSPSLSPSHNTYLSLYFSFCICFLLWMSVLLLKVTKPFCNPLWWMHECVCGINFIFEVEVLWSIACWLRSEPPLKVCINCISWMMTRCSEQHWRTFQRKLFASLPQPQELDNWKWGWASKLPLRNLSF